MELVLAILSLLVRTTFGYACAPATFLLLFLRLGAVGQSINSWNDYHKGRIESGDHKGAPYDATIKTFVCRGRPLWRPESEAVSGIIYPPFIKQIGITG
jgi:hypothetical protein